MTASAEPYGPLDFARDSGVPRETLSRLAIYAELLTEWNAHLNLVSTSTLDDVWRRHFLDSAQLVPLIPETAKRIVDLGSGAGFPGMVLAIILRDRPNLKVHLIEATQKKCKFLEEVAKATGAAAQVHWTRAESLTHLKADVVTARAVAPLKKLFELSIAYFAPGTIGLFPKGRALDDELTQAGESWKIAATRVPSLSDPSGTILRVTGLAPWRKPRKSS